MTSHRDQPTAFMHASDVSIGPPDFPLRPDGITTPRLTPVEWARRRRVQKEMRRRSDSVRNRTMGRLHRLGDEWHLIEAAGSASTSATRSWRSVRAACSP